MRFRTEYTPVNPGFFLDPEKPVTLLGSCFADNITKRMRMCMWDAENPFGVLFNPLSIASAIKLALFSGNREKEIEDSIFGSDGFFHSWLFDSKKSGESKQSVISHISAALDEFSDRLMNSGALIITFGTAWCYFLSDKENHIVANCHKQPQRLFTRRRVSVKEITGEWLPLTGDILAAYPSLRIIFTVSPVRHLKDGHEGNALSKATLLLAIEEICRQNGRCHYFPAFEILNDDLRDYRFYADDLTHPSASAVEYIWEMFRMSYLDRKGIDILKEGENLAKRLMHKGVLEGSSQEMRFCEETRLLSANFANAHPGMLPSHRLQTQKDRQ